jgi:hypothetical protein
LASEWSQEEPYEDLATNPADEERHGIRTLESSGGEDDRIDDFDRTGAVVGFVALPPHTMGVGTQRRLDLWDDLMIASYIKGDALDSHVHRTSLYKGGVEVSRLRWHYMVQVTDVAVNNHWVFVAGHGHLWPLSDNGVSVFSVEDLEAYGIQEEPHSFISPPIAIIDAAEPIAAISTTKDNLFVFTTGGTVTEYSPDLTPIRTTQLFGWADFIVDGHPGVDGTFVPMTVSAPDSDWCSISVHGADGSLQDCFANQPGGASGFGGFDVDGCGGIVVPDATTEDGDLTGHKFIPSNRDPGCFIDSLDSIFVNAIADLGRAGITKGCNPSDNDRFCPQRNVTRGEIAAFFTRALDLPAASTDYFTDDDGSIFENSINRLAEAGITKGCNPPANDRFCPQRNVTRGEIAAFFSRGLDL